MIKTVREILSRNLKDVLSDRDVVSVELVEYNEPERRPFHRFTGQIRVTDGSGRTDSYQIWPQQYESDGSKVIGGTDSTKICASSEPLGNDGTTKDADIRLRLQGGARRRVKLDVTQQGRGRRGGSNRSGV